MRQDIYKKTEQFVVDSFNKADKSSQIPHFLRTVHWVKVLRPDADEALLTAAVAHDIERAFRKTDMLRKKEAIGLVDLNFIRPHEERGAEIIGEFLEHQDVNDDLIEKIKTLIARHEEGGDSDQNILKDADSISFFENNATLLINEKASVIGKDKIGHKLDWMFERISSKEARDITEPLYKEAIKDLKLKK